MYQDVMEEEKKAVVSICKPQLDYAVESNIDLITRISP